MRKRTRLAGLAMAALGPFAVRAGAQALPQAPAPPTVWISPPASDNGRSLRELFERPEQWTQARAGTDVLFYTDLNFQHQFSDDELRAWLPKLGQWHVKLALEVGAVKEWGVTGQKTFQAEQPLWERIQRLGGPIYAVAMDEPLSCVRQLIKKPDDYAVTETADYVARVRQRYPKMLVGDIEPYPSISLADHLKWIDALQGRLAQRHVRGLDFYRLDVDGNNLLVAPSSGSWREVTQIERHCHETGLPFSLIYWAADYPELKRRGLADDSTWYVSVMQQGYDYALVGGTPDQYVIESWVGAPAACLPDTSGFTFTRTVRDFVQKFVKRPSLPLAPTDSGSIRRRYPTLYDQARPY